MAVRPRASRRPGQQLRFQCNKVLVAGANPFSYAQFGIGGDLLQRPCRTRYVVIRAAAAVPCIGKMDIYTPSESYATVNDVANASTAKTIGTNNSTFIVKTPRITDFAPINSDGETVVTCNVTGPCTVTLELCIEFKPVTTLRSIL